MEDEFDTLQEFDAVEDLEALHQLCKDCYFWDPMHGCMEKLNKSMVDCRFSRSLIIPEFDDPEGLDMDENDD